jgi:hypothetical protein
VAITLKERAEVQESGASVKTEALVDQAGYHFELVASDPAVQAKVGEALLKDIHLASDAVKAAAGDREVADEEKQASTGEVGSSARAGRLWLRKTKDGATEAELAGAKVPRELLSLGEKNASVSVLTQRIRSRIPLLEPLAQTHAEFGLDPALVDEGKGLLTQLEADRAGQHHKHLAAAPEKVRDLWYQKGLLLLGLKRLNAIAHRVHLNNPEAAARYNLSLLHAGRKNGKGVAKPIEGVEPG